MPRANHSSSCPRRQSSAAGSIAAIATTFALAVESPIRLLAALGPAQAPAPRQQQPVRDSPPGQQDQAVQPPAGLVGAQPLPPATIRQANLDLEAALKTEAALIEGDRVGPDGEAVGWTVEGGLILTRDLWAALLRNRAAELEKIRHLSREEKLALIATLRDAAPALRDAYLNMVAAEGAALDPYRHERAAYEALLSDADAADKAAADPSISAGQKAQLTARAADLRDRADRSPWKFYADRRATFFGLLEASPENSLLGLYQDNWVMPNKYLFQTFLHTSYSLDPTRRDNDLIADFDGYLDVNINRMRTLATKAEEIDEFEDLLEFLNPKYENVHRLARAISTSTGLTFPALAVDPFADIARSYELAEVFGDTVGAILLAVVCLGSMVIPIVGAIVNTGVAVLELVHEGGSYALQWSRENDARLTAAITGQQHVISEDERTSARGGRLVLAVIQAASTVPFARVTVREAMAVQRQQSRLAARVGVDVNLADTAGVQRGAQRARELGIGQETVDTYLQRARTADHETILQRVRARGVRDGSDEFADAVEAETTRDWAQAQPFASSLAQIGRLDDMAAAARAAGVPEDEIAAIFAAAQKTGSIRTIAQDLPQQLLRATLQRRNITIVVDGAYARRVNVGAGRETVPDYPMHAYLQFWNTVTPPPALRADMNALLTIREKLSVMGRGGVVTWTNLEIRTLGHIVRRPDAHRLFAYVSDENVFVRLFNDDQLQTARNFFGHPNRHAIANGQAVLPLTRRLTLGEAPLVEASVDPFDRFMLTGGAASTALLRLSRPGEPSVALAAGLDPFSPEALAGDLSPVSAPSLRSRFITGAPTVDDLENWAVDRAQSRFGSVENWRTTVLPDGRVAVTSPDIMRRVTVSVTPLTDGQSRIDFATEERRGRFIDQEYTREVNLRFDLQMGGETLLDLGVESRPTRVRTPAPRPTTVPGAPSSTPGQTSAAPGPIGVDSAMAFAYSSPGAVAPVGSENVWTPRPFTATTTAIERSGVASARAPAMPITINLTQPQAWSPNPDLVVNSPLFEVVQAITTTTDGAEVEAPPWPEFQGPVPVGWLHSAGRALIAWLQHPAAHAARASAARISARPTAGRSQPSSTGASPAAAAPVTIVFRSLGRSSGDAIEMTVFNRGSAPVRLGGDGIVLEPVANVTRQQLEGEMKALASAGRATATLKGYCLEFRKQPPTEGVVFRLGSQALQKRYAQVTSIFEASRRLRAGGRLTVPPGDPSSAADFFDAVRQWAIWTRQERFDERGYTRAFVQHARKNVEASGTAWTDRYEKAFAGLAPGRWQAIQTVLREADAMPAR